MGTERAEKIYDKNGEPTPETAFFPQVTQEFTSTASVLIAEVKGSTSYDIVVKQHPDWEKHHPNWDKCKDK